MANETPITLTGRLASDPTLRFTPSGAAVCSFRVLSTPRSWDKNRQEWVDGETLGMDCSAWRQAAENAAETLQKGMAVIVAGRLKSRSYEAKDGSRRTVFEIDVEDVGPSLRYATAKVTKAGGRDSRPEPSRSQQAARDPWAAASADDQPPF